MPLTADSQLVGDEFRVQAAHAFANLGRCLSAAGGVIADVFKVNGYLTSCDEFAVYDEVYSQFFTAPLPARTTVQVGLYGFKIEVEAWAYRHP